MNFKKAPKGHNSPITFFVFSLLISIIFVSIVYIVNYSSREEKIVERFQDKLLAQLTELANKGDLVQSLIVSGEENLWPKLERIVNQDNTYALVFFHDSLLFWNNNQIPESSLKGITQQDQVLYTNNGWYLLHKETYKGYKVYLLKQIKSVYLFENLILPVKINEDFSDCQNLKFTFDKGAANYLIYDQENLFLIGLDFEDYSPLNSNQILILFLLFIGIYYFLIECISAIYNKYVKFRINEITILILFIIDVILLRFLDYYFQFPGVLKDSFLFEQNMNSLIGFSSVGDLVLNSLLIVFIAAQIYSYTKGRKLKPGGKRVIIRLVIAYIILFIFVCSQLTVIRYAIIGLPYHSFFGVSFDSITGVLTGLSIVTLALAVLIFGRAFGRYFILLKVPAGYHFFVVAAIAVCSYYFFDFQNQIIILSAVFIILLLTIVFFVRDTQNINFIKYLVFIVLLSGTTAVVVNSARNFKKNSHQVLLSNKLSNSVDRSLENVYDEFQNQINQDTTFNNLVFSSIDEESILSDYLSTQYFGEYSKYNIQLTVCEDGENLEIQPEGLIVDCSDYFENLISINGEPTNSANLFLIRGDPKSIYYVGNLTVTDPSDPGALINMYVEFYFTFIPEGLGYPELLVDNTLFEVDLSGYSYARYSENQLLNSFGNFPYQTNYDFLEEYPNNDIFIFNASKHYKQNLSPEEYLIVSQPVERMSVQLVTFSSLFIIIAIILFVAFLIIYGKEARKVFQMSFQTRLQMIFISTISFIIILLAIITLYYVETGNEQKLAEQLTEKTNSVIIELEHKLSGEADLVNYNSLELEQLLRKFSLVFFSDINVYSPSGRLLATSRPEIFEKGLISEFVNPMAYEELFEKNKLYYLTQESIGDVTYHSSYAQLILGGGQTAGIINLPYFARQSEVVRSYYLMIFTFINAFVLLGIVGAFIAIALSKVITKPLVVLQKSLAGIQIDKQNEPIDWDSDDEIGQLIAEYNRLIDKLEQSTALLKQSERESTWREVAQQIAHEIKNPLTPMKLNVQYLEKAFNQGDPNLDEKVKSISASLVNQIDTLNKVAEMFSDFATSNVQNFKKVDLLKVISESIQLFKNNPGVTLTLETEKMDGLYIIHANEKDLLRLFNNLIKNAVQSIDGNNEGFIRISLNAKEGRYIVRITDNGKGIPDGAKASIFQPYFTTKSGGTGLGLAIVKNIMTEIGGEINFESQVSEGTVFILKFKPWSNWT